MEYYHKEIDYKGQKIFITNDVNFLGRGNMPTEGRLKMYARNETHWASMEVPVQIIGDEVLTDMMCRELFRKLFLATVASGKL